MDLVQNKRSRLRKLAPVSEPSESTSFFVPFREEDIPTPECIGEKIEEVSTYQKVAHHLRLAVMEGGTTNPKYNQKLMSAIKMAQDNNVVPETINRIIKECKPDRDIKKSYVLQMRFQRKIFIICTVFTNNLMSLKRKLFQMFKKHGAAFIYALHMFNSCAQIEAIMSYRTAVEFNNIEGALARDAIRCKAIGVEVVDYATGAVNFKCSPMKLAEVCEAVKERSYKIVHTEYGFQPKVQIDLTPTERKDYNRFLRKLREFHEVDKIFDNVRVVDEPFYDDDED